MRFVLLLVILGVHCGCSQKQRSNQSAETKPITTQAGTIETPVEPKLAATKVDSVDTLIASLSASHGMWVNGISPTIELPATASTEEIVSRFFQSVSYDQGPVSSHRIMETRHVRIDNTPDPNYVAVLVDTNLGRKILLIQYSFSRWWTRVFDDRPAT